MGRRTCTATNNFIINLTGWTPKKDLPGMAVRYAGCPLSPRQHQVRDQASLFSLQ
jgi:hypothetical protein